ncbi:MAG: phenylalanine--tRNA ligase subunit beta [Candidatus Korobacteraceae bacterium]|jgi:phenylalanyl-tRNA synthetase beta chain
MKILPAWVAEFADIGFENRILTADEAEGLFKFIDEFIEKLTSAGIAVESFTLQIGQQGEFDPSLVVFEMDLTTNRVDAMNHYGVAREASAIYDVDLKPVEPKLPKPKVRRTAPPNISGPIGMTSLTKQMEAAAATLDTDAFPIVIEDAQGCARYTARIVRNVKIGPSPQLVARRLELLGSRPINNAADATNYALNELGHPTHAFDLDLLEGGTIIVRRARAGEVLKTLDGVDRKLTTDDLVIADWKKPVALAGVMGGFDSMITERTKNVLIESAWFDPATVRSMAKRHLMHTDASHRFERGADWGITPLACDRVTELILASAGGELYGEQIDTVARKAERASIALHRSEVNRILGIDLDEDEIQRILGRLGFGVTRNAEGDFRVQVPTWRLDVEREIDVLEELARIHGYNNFPNTLPAFAGAVVTLPDEPKNAKVRETMLALGYDESISITFISEQEAKAFGGGEPLAIANPLSEEAGYLRTSLIPGLLNMVGYNLNRGNANVRLFEAGEVFEKLGDRSIEDERRHLGFVATGDAITKSVHSPAQPYTFFHVKGDIEELLAAFEHQKLHFDDQTPPYFHPGRSARVVMDGETVAVFGQLHPDLAAARKLRQEVYVAELMLDRLYRHPLREPRYQRISKFPTVERDFSFIFDEATTFERIRLAIDELGLNELQQFVPAEIFRGEKVGQGKYSVLLHAEFQSEERTLRDDEVAQWSEKIVAKLQSLGGVLRAQ